MSINWRFACRAKITGLVCVVAAVFSIPFSAAQTKGQLEPTLPTFRIHADAIDTSLLLNGDFTQGADYWDRPGLQEPVNGWFKTYDPDTDPGLNAFDVVSGLLTVEPGEEVQQRILLSPGSNRISGRYSSYDPIAGAWTPFATFQQVVDNPYPIHVMHCFSLDAKDGLRTRYTDVKADCPSHRIAEQALKAELLDELTFILDLHSNTSRQVGAGPNALFPYTGLHPSAKYSDYRDLGSFVNLVKSLHVPSPHAKLYLSAAENNLSAYAATGYSYALGGLATLSTLNGQTVPFRYDYSSQRWSAPSPGQPMVYSTLLEYLCRCADHYKDADFFEGAFLVAREMLERNWWNLHTDPEGLFFVSNEYALDASDVLEGYAIVRTPSTFAGASITEDNEDHLLMLGAAALSFFVRVAVENPTAIQGTSITPQFLLDCQDAVYQTIESYCTYADRFNLNWISDFAGQVPLTAAWWSNYDRRDDFIGYNLGLGLAKIFEDQCSLYGYAAIQSDPWVQKMFLYLEDYQPLWDENTRRGGIEAADGYRFYAAFNEIWQVPEAKPWTEGYLSTYTGGLIQMFKGFSRDGYAADIGTWAIWDFEPYQFFTTKEVTVPGLLFSFGGDIYETLNNMGNGEDEKAFIRALMHITLETIVKTSKGEAGYQKDLTLPDEPENGGEFRLATGLFRLYSVL